MNPIFRVVKWSVVALLIAPLLYVLLQPVLRGEVDVDGVWLILVIFLLLPALIYGAGVSTKWGIIVVGSILVLVTARTWWIFWESDPYNPFNGLIPIVGLIPAGGIALFGALADLSYRFFREPSVRRRA